MATTMNRGLPEYHEYMGKNIRIIDMDGEPQYCGRVGKVTRVDDKGQLHGTWGGCALIVGVDRFCVLEG